MKLLTHGFGVEQGLLAFYIENTPPMSEWHGLSHVHALDKGQIEVINTACGNGWRKAFNVFAKVLEQLNHSDHNFTNYSSWQDYRDNCLLQAHAQEALLFSPPDLDKKAYKFHIIAGRTYAKKLLRDQVFTNSLVWLDEEFAVDPVSKIVICPYLDYRQLSNIKISQLVEILKSIED